MEISTNIFGKTAVSLSSPQERGAFFLLILIPNYEIT